MSTLPIKLIQGRNKEVVIWVQAGAHGDETEGILALKRYCEAARAIPPPVSLKVLCPANSTAFASSSRCSPVDGLDLNRSFPGNINGSITQQTAAFIWDQIRSCQGIVDIHSSSDTLIGAPHAIIQEGDTSNHHFCRAIGKASSLPILWSSKGAWLAGSLIHAAMATGIPACLLDIGSSRPWEKIPTLESTLTPVLETYGDLSTTDLGSPQYLPAANDKQATIEITDPTWIMSPASGWIVTIQGPGSLVRQGEVLALIWDEEQATDHSVTWEGPGQGLVVTVRARRDVTASSPLASIAALPTKEAVAAST